MSNFSHCCIHYVGDPKQKIKIISVSRTNPLYGEDHEAAEKVFQEKVENDEKIKNVPTTSSSSGYSSNQRLPLPQVTNLHGSNRAMNSNDNDDDGTIHNYHI